MKLVTNIKQISSNKYSLTIDNKKHIVYDDVLLQYGILKKGEISEEVYNKIVSANNYHEVYNKMLKYITAKLRTESEIRTKLTKLYIKKEDQDTIIERLRKEKYLNDELYINSYINDNVILSLNGPKKIEYELIKLGFKERLICNALGIIEEQVWIEKAQILLNKRLKSNHNLSKKAFISKMKNDYIKLGYEEKYYIQHLNTVDFDDTIQLEKDYQKLLKRLSKKYSDQKLKIVLKQKLYQLGYDIDKISNIIE